MAYSKGLKGMLDQDVREVLEDLEYLPGYKVKITHDQLERGLYERVNEVLVRILGKWKGGKTAAHVFPHDPKPLIDAILSSNQMPPKNPYAFFPTPKSVTIEMLYELTERKEFAERARKWDGTKFEYQPLPIAILEPSAGMGGIVDYVKPLLLENDRLDCVEIAPIQATMLRQKGYNVYEQDFLSYNQKPYDYILMNPPFSVEDDQTAYISHIYHAWQLLKDGGTLFAVVPPGWVSNQAKKFQSFREFVSKYGRCKVDFPAGTFKESGTNILTTLLQLRKSEDSTVDVETNMARLYVFNDRETADAARNCKSVDELETFITTTLWKTAFNTGDFIYTPYVDVQRIYDQLQED